MKEQEGLEVIKAMLVILIAVPIWVFLVITDYTEDHKPNSFKCEYTEIAE